MLRIIDCRYPLKSANGYEYTENFDGLIQTENNRYYFNLKFVCDNGGSQTRTYEKHIILFGINWRFYYLIKIIFGNYRMKNNRFILSIFWMEILLVKLRNILIIWFKKRNTEKSSRTFSSAIYLVFKQGIWRRKSMKNNPC